MISDRILLECSWQGPGYAEKFPTCKVLELVINLRDSTSTGFFKDTKSPGARSVSFSGCRNTGVIKLLVVGVFLLSLPVKAPDHHNVIIHEMDDEVPIVFSTSNFFKFKFLQLQIFSTSNLFNF